MCCMTLAVRSLIIFIFSTFPIANSQDILTKKIHHLCFPFDSCKEMKGPEVIPFNRCQCKASCVRFDTCCLDSPYRDPKATAVFNKKRKESCEPVRPHRFGTFMVSQCQDGWRGCTLVKTMCESPAKNMSDPLSVMPVTNTKSETNYRNYFCAVCNNDSQYLRFWEITLSYNPYRSKVRATDIEPKFSGEIEYSISRDKWGFLSNNSVITEVDVGFQPPRDLHDIISQCVPDVISDCHSTWNDEDIREKCSSHMALVLIQQGSYENTILFRNKHCAVCNFMSVTEREYCQQEDAGDDRQTGSSTGRKAFTLTWLLDMNLSDGDKVGLVNPCSHGQIYDPFYRRCRTLTCALPGHVLKNGRCVPY